jgi:hypothetical protein
MTVSLKKSLARKSPERRAKIKAEAKRMIDKEGRLLAKPFDIWEYLDTPEHVNAYLVESMSAIHQDNQTILAHVKRLEKIISRVWKPK